MKILILRTQEGDWEGLFIDNDLIDEGHVLGEGNSTTYLLEKAEEYGFSSKDIKEKELNDIDEKGIAINGCFPDSLTKLSGDYIDDPLIILKDDCLITLDTCTRVEVIESSGSNSNRAYVNWSSKNNIRISLQDESRTLKIFIEKL